MGLRAGLLAGVFGAALLPTIAAAQPQSTNGNNAPNNLLLGNLTRTYSGRPLNGAPSNGAALTNSGNINWLGNAAIKFCDLNPFNNQGTWVGCEVAGTLQALDTASVLEVGGQPGAPLGIAVYGRSLDNGATDWFAHYIASESDGSVNGGVNKSAWGGYILGWNRHLGLEPYDSALGVTTGFHHAIGWEIDMENEEPLVGQGPYLMGYQSFVANLWLVCGGDFSAVRQSTDCPVAITMLVGSNGTGHLFDRGIVPVASSFEYTHGLGGDQASVMEMGANMGIWWDTTSQTLMGGITGISTNNTFAMDIAFCNSGLCFRDVSGNIIYNMTTGGFFNINGTGMGQHKVVTVQDKRVTVAQYGSYGALIGSNGGNDWELDQYSDPEVNTAAVNTPGSGYTGTSGTLTYSGATPCSTPPVLNATASGGQITGITSVSNIGLCQDLIAATDTSWTPGAGLSAGSGFSAFLTWTSALLWHGITANRASGIVIGPQGFVSGGQMSTSSPVGYLGWPLQNGTPSVVPSMPITAGYCTINSSSGSMNCYYGGSWHHTAAMSPGTG